MHKLRKISALSAFRLFRLGSLPLSKRQTRTKDSVWQFLLMPLISYRNAVFKVCKETGFVRSLACAKYYRNNMIKN